MHRIPRIASHIVKTAQAAAVKSPSAPGVAAAAGAAPRPDAIPTAPMRRDFGTRFSFDTFRLSGKEERKKTSFVNPEHAEAILKRAPPSALEPRDPSKPPTREGLLAVIAYTSNGMLAAQINDALAGKKIPTLSADGNADLKEFADLVAETVSRLKPLPVDTVRRNTAIDAEGLARYGEGSTISISKLVSVTLNDGQVYTGGNVDFVYHPRKESGVVSIAALSEYKNENEGLLVPDQDRLWVVDKVEAAREGAGQGLDPENYPPRTIHLREV
ncbi:hypothetical protein SAMN05216552_101154 [Pseudoduganella namucuonensis]|uniref:Uncharacterized protein n=2 Tax=Pseudoduganella namucuonensis TaxID=1035707 RepID=A0A1I7JED5_9BURK|nr:hypothetical protein SAMN05216552_101154 [Pseudoduganella namucuonensis]